MPEYGPIAPIDVVKKRQFDDVYSGGAVQARNVSFDGTSTLFQGGKCATENN